MNKLTQAPHGEPGNLMGAYREIDRLREVIEKGECRFNCRASRKADFEAGWKGAQVWEEKLIQIGERADELYGLEKAFEEHTCK